MRPVLLQTQWLKLPELAPDWTQRLPGALALAPARPHKGAHGAWFAPLPAEQTQALQTWLVTQGAQLMQGGLVSLSQGLPGLQSVQRTLYYGRPNPAGDALESTGLPAALSLTLQARAEDTRTRLAVEVSWQGVWQWRVAPGGALQPQWESGRVTLCATMSPGETLAIAGLPDTLKRPGTVNHYAEWVLLLTPQPLE